MLKSELLEVLTVEQYQKFHNGTRIVSTVTLPDGRKVAWYEDYEVHEFLKNEGALDEPTTGTAGPVC